MQLVQCYTDGSCNNHAVSWSFVIQKDGKVIKQDSGSVPGEECIKHRQIAGEIFGVIKAVEYCKKNNLLAEIYVDYIGLIHWVADTLNSGHAVWSANTEFSKGYKSFIARNREVVVSINHVKGHSGVEFNELADKLAKKVLGL